MQDVLFLVLGVEGVILEGGILHQYFGDNGEFIL